jgi:hypothetical protein
MSSSEYPGWVIKESTSRPGVKYYFNEKTRESRWEPPSVEQEVRASHILKKHRGSRRPASWRCDNITQSKEEAISQIKEIKRQLEETLKTKGQQDMIQLSLCNLTHQHVHINISALFLPMHHTRIGAL